MSECITQNKDKSIEQSNILKVTEKTTFDFDVPVDYKDRFLQLIHNLSVPEFSVDVELENIWMRKNREKYNTITFRVKASGARCDLNRWVDNINQVKNFLNGETGIVFNKIIEEQQFSL